MLAPESLQKAMVSIVQYVTAKKTPDCIERVGAAAGMVGQLVSLTLYIRHTILANNQVKSIWCMPRVKAHTIGKETNVLRMPLQSKLIELSRAVCIICLKPLRMR